MILLKNTAVERSGQLVFLSSTTPFFSECCMTNTAQKLLAGRTKQWMTQPIPVSATSTCWIGMPHSECDGNNMSYIDIVELAQNVAQSRKCSEKHDRCE